MLTKDNILNGYLISIFIFPLPTIVLDIGNRIRNEAEFSSIELAAQEEMGWSNKRLVKYASVACGYFVDDKSTSLERFYKFYFGNHNPSKEPYIKKIRCGKFMIGLKSNRSAIDDSSLADYKFFFTNANYTIIWSLNI